MDPKIVQLLPGWMEVPQRKKWEMETSFWDVSPDLFITKGKCVFFVFKLLLERENQKGGEARWCSIWILYAMCDESPLAELRAEDRGRSIRAGCYARGWRGRKGGGAGDSLSLPTLESLPLCSVTVRSRQLTQHATCAEFKPPSQCKNRTERRDQVIPRNRCRLAYISTRCFLKLIIFFNSVKDNEGAKKLPRHLILHRLYVI